MGILSPKHGVVFLSRRVDDGIRKPWYDGFQQGRRGNRYAEIHELTSPAKRSNSAFKRALKLELLISGQTAHLAFRETRAELVCVHANF